jgi:hypothetical protein
MRGTEASSKQSRGSEEVRATQESSLACAYLKADRDHSPTDLLPHHELLAQHGQDQIFPATGGQALPQPNDPLATIFIRIILKKTTASKLKYCSTDFFFYIKAVNNQSPLSQGYGSSSRVPAQQTQGPEYKPLNIKGIPLMTRKSGHFPIF